MSNKIVSNVNIHTECILSLFLMPVNDIEGAHGADRVQTLT